MKIFYSSWFSHDLAFCHSLTYLQSECPNFSNCYGCFVFPRGEVSRVTNGFSACLWLCKWGRMAYTYAGKAWSYIQMGCMWEEEGRTVTAEALHWCNINGKKCIFGWQNFSFSKSLSGNLNTSAAKKMHKINFASQFLFYCYKTKKKHCLNL